MLRVEMIFRDRREAGYRLGRRLAERDWTGHPLLVLGLPRGGVPVAAEVAEALGAPLDVFVVRKLGVPWQPELAMGAIAPGPGGEVVRVMNDEVVRLLQIDDAAIDAAVRRENAELQRRQRLYRGERPPLEVEGRAVVLVDDGMATGSTMLAALAALRESRPARLVAAVPVGAPETCDEVAREADELVCLARPSPFHAVGLWYEEFAPTSDDEVRRLLDATGGLSSRAPAP